MDTPKKPMANLTGGKEKKRKWGKAHQIFQS
jgi:hypothetical protein